MSGSIRGEVARNLADTCVFGGLNDVYGVILTKVEEKRSYWSVTFCKSRVLDGVIKVYGPGFILVEWQTAYRDMAARGKQVLKSEGDAKEFITKSFIRP